MNEMALYVPGYLHNSPTNPVGHAPSIFFVSPANFTKIRVEYNGKTYLLVQQSDKRA